MIRDASHGPTGTWSGSQLRVSPSVNGVEPSPGSRSFAPGQRASLPTSNPAASKPASLESSISIGFSRSASPPSPTEKALNVVSMRPSGPEASKRPEVEKPSNQPTSSGV